MQTGEYARRSRLTFVFVVLLWCGATALALETARMALPDYFEERVERIPIAGYGGRNKGTFTLGAHHGDFRRIETRLGIFDPLYARSRASGSFSLHGPGFDVAVSASCAMTQGTVTIGVITFDPKKMTYQCSFSRGDSPLDARLVLGKPRPDSAGARILARAERRGEAVIEGVRVGIRSVHKFKGTRWQSDTPTGYLFSVDDRDIGALELTDTNPTIFLPRGDSTPTQRAVLLAAMAVSVLRDPAESALGD